MELASSSIFSGAALGYATLAACSLLFTLYYSLLKNNKKKGDSNRRLVPQVPGGLPLLGNLLQLKEKMPYKLFTKWAESYGPIYSIKVGYSSIVVLNTTAVVKEAMVTKFSSISTRKLSKALTLLTADKSLVSTSDYDDFYKTVKRHFLTKVLSPSAHKMLGYQRVVMVENIAMQLQAHAKAHPGEALNFRSIFEPELFGLSMRQAIGRDVDHIYVKELGGSVSKEEIFRILVVDPMAGGIAVDWRDFFPYLRWIPNPTFEKRIEGIRFRREVVMNALIRECKQQIASGEAVADSFMKYLLSEATTLTDLQIMMLIWEAIIAAADTITVATEWAMYELAKNSDRQEKLFQEIQSVCGSEGLSEQHLSKLPYLNAVFQETLRRHSPVPIVPLRHVDVDTELGGYHVPAGTQVAMSLYGCNMDKKQWGDVPEDWLPERFLELESNTSTELHKTMAFGGGRRACIGYIQATSVACTSIGKMVQQFEWRLNQGEEEKVDTMTFTARKLEPLHVTIKPRRSLA